MRRKLFLIFLINWVLVLISSCNSDNSNSGNGSETDSSVNEVSFSNPIEVTIHGYSGDAQEPQISKDGNTLFFNNLNSDTLPGGAENDTNIHYATRLNDTTFQYEGELVGANTDEVVGINELEGVASIDKNNNFYFVSTIQYLNSESPDFLRSLYKADYDNGSLNNIISLPNLKSNRPPEQAIIPGELNFDAEINYNGETLYYVEGLFSGSPFPDEANIAIAEMEGDDFIANPNSGALFEKINTDDREYAPSISTNELELYFSRFTGSIEEGFEFGIYVATRSYTFDPWDNVKLLDATHGVISEAPSISFDGELLYFHQSISGVFKIFVVERD